MKLWKWENHYHPDNPNFCQVVFWKAWLNNTGRITLTYSLSPTGAGKVHQYLDAGTDMGEFKKSQI